MFLVRPDGSVRFFGGVMSLVDAGDYDGDGASELLVMWSESDVDGYILFDSRLEELGRFGWGWQKGGKAWMKALGWDPSAWGTKPGASHGQRQPEPAESISR